MRPLFLAICLLLATEAPAAQQATRNIAYGTNPAQRLDVYRDDTHTTGPVIIMLHGGGWRRGSKSMPGVWRDKAAWWLPKGYVFVSVETRLLPDARPDEQLEDYARAVAFVQANAGRWGGDPGRIVLMGHSAGAHIAALLASDAEVRQRHGLHGIRAAVALDSGALDLEAVMQAWHFRLYDDAFGTDPAYWAQMSPMAQVSRGDPPILAVCASKRRRVCDEARDFSRAAARNGVKVSVLPMALTHGEINSTLGTPSAYTQAVTDWIAQAVAR